MYLYKLCIGYLFFSIKCFPITYLYVSRVLLYCLVSMIELFSRMFQGTRIPRHHRNVMKFEKKSPKAKHVYYLKLLFTTTTKVYICVDTLQVYLYLV